MNYKETGNKIPISVPELIDFAHQKLAEYDSAVSTNKSISFQNPYSEPIIYPTKDGKTIMVPNEIQKQAIDLWYNKTGRNVPVMQQIPQNEQIVEQPKQEVIYVYEDGNDIFKLAILIVAALFALYLFFNMRETSGSSMSMDKVKFYLVR
jgi:hypothetical protein